MERRAENSLLGVLPAARRDAAARRAVRVKEEAIVGALGDLPTCSRSRERVRRETPRDRAERHPDFRVLERPSGPSCLRHVGYSLARRSSYE